MPSNIYLACSQQFYTIGQSFRKIKVLFLTNLFRTIYLVLILLKVIYVFKDLLIKTIEKNYCHPTFILSLFQNNII